MNRLKLFFISLSFLLILNITYAYVNPAMDLCMKQGYEYNVETNEDGSQTGYCVIKGEEYEVWEWYNSNNLKRDNQAKISTIEPISRDRSDNETQQINKSYNSQKTDNKFKSSTSKISNSRNDITDTTRGYTSPSLDWRNKDGQNWVSQIKDQGACGSCWAFSANGVMESRVKIDLNNVGYSVDLSEQDALTNNVYGGNCIDGGFEWYSFDYAKNTGIVKESCMPYGGSKCSNWQNEKMMLTDYARISANANSIKDAVTDYGPVTSYMVVCDGFDGTGIYSHVGDVWFDDSCWHDGGDGYYYLNMHSVDIIGYDDSSQYWIAKNSWGTGWGDNGFIKIAYSQSVYDYSSWHYAVWNLDGGDPRVFFLDDSYYVTGTDTLTIPTISAFFSNNSYARGDNNISFSANVQPKSIKQISSVRINGTDMSGIATGGIFTLSKKPSDFGCQDFEGYCNLLLTVIDDSGKSNTGEISIRIDDFAPRVTDFKIKNTDYYIKNQTLLLTVNVTDADISSVKINNASFTFSDNLYRFYVTPYEIGCLSNAVCVFNVTAIDAVGNTNYSESKIFFFDDVMPTINSVNNSDYIVRTGTNVTITVNATDNINISSVTAEGFELNYTDNFWIGNITLLGSGFINVTVIDFAGNRVNTNNTTLNNNFMVGYQIDDTPPIISNLQINPNHAKLNSHVNISFNIIDSHFRMLNISINNSIIRQESLDTINSYDYGYVYNISSNNTEGITTVEIIIIDEAENVVYANSTFIIDFTPPNITAVSPQNNSQIHTNYTWINLTTDESTICGENDEYNYIIFDTTPPAPFNGSPTGSVSSNLESGICGIDSEFFTNERADCRGSLANGTINKEFLTAGDSVTFNGINVRLVRCGAGNAVVDIGGTVYTINEGDIRNSNGIKVRVENIFNEEGTQYDMATVRLADSDSNIALPNEDYNTMNITFELSQEDDSVFSYSSRVQVNTTDEYSLYVKCKDMAGNLMSEGYSWSFIIGSVSCGSSNSGGNSGGGGSSGVNGEYTINHSEYYGNLSDDSIYVRKFVCTDYAGNSKTISFSNQINITYPPSITILSNITVNETDLINFTVNAADQDNDTLTYYINNHNFSQLNNSFSWLTTTNDSGVYNIIIIVSDSIFNTTESFNLTINDVPDKDKDNIPDSIDPDDDNDGVNDTSDKLLGCGSSINTSTMNMSLKVDNATLNNTYEGEKNLTFYDGEKPIIDFMYNFTNSTLDLYSIRIEKQTNNSHGLITISGLELPNNMTKIVYVDRLTNDTNSVCVKDSENTSVSSLCVDADEYPIDCPGTNNGYECTLTNNNLTFKISGLHHSGVSEQTYCGDGTIQSGESCEGSNLNGKTCATYGYNAGSLSCSNSCAIITSGCSTTSSGSGGGGGGGGGGGSSSGGGGGGGSVEIYNFGNLSETGTMFISNEKYSVREIFVKVNNLVLNAKLFVEEKITVKDNPLTDKRIYKYVVLSGNVENEFKEGTIKFRIPKVWISNTTYNESEIILSQETNNIWNELSTTKLDTDVEYGYYSSKITKIGTFAIAQKEILRQKSPESIIPKEKTIKTEVKAINNSDNKETVILSNNKKDNSVVKIIVYALVAVSIMTVVGYVITNKRKKIIHHSKHHK